MRSSAASRDGRGYATLRERQAPTTSRTSWRYPTVEYCARASRTRRVASHTGRGSGHTSCATSSMSTTRPSGLRAGRQAAGARHAPAEALPAELVALLTRRVGLAEHEVAAMTKEEA